MSDATEISAARTRLYGALSVDSVAPWRIHRTAPAQVAAPSIWLDSVELTLDLASGASFIVAAFPVFLVVDGAVRKQIEELDDVLARVWTAASTVGEPTSSRPQPLDVGGASLRAQVLSVDMLIQARTLCPLDLAPVGGIP